MAFKLTTYHYKSDDGKFDDRFRFAFKMQAISRFEEMSDTTFFELVATWESSKTERDMLKNLTMKDIKLIIFVSIQNAKLYGKFSANESIETIEDFEALDFSLEEILVMLGKALESIDVDQAKKSKNLGKK